MSTDNEIIKDLIGALSSNTIELNNLTRQVATQGDTLNEVKRHSESVKKSVNWANLGDDVYEGVAAANIAKIEETTGASATVIEQAKDLAAASREQQHAVDELKSALKTTSEEKRAATHATERLHRAAEMLMATHKGAFVRMALVATLTASLGLFGGYWWAKGNVRKEGLAEVGQLLGSSNGQSYCADMSGTVLQADNNGIYCASWIKRPKEAPVE